MTNGFFTVTVFLHSYYRYDLTVEEAVALLAERIANAALSLPIGPHLSDDQVGEVINHVAEVAR